MIRQIHLLALASTFAIATSAQTIIQTPAYRWEADTIFQGPYKAYAPDPYTIISDYASLPGYHMPIEKEWHRRNNLDSYPHLITNNTLHAAIFNLGLDEMVNAVEKDSTLRTGREWPGVWTRDVSYSIILAMAALQPEASRISLERKISKTGRIIQDTGSGGAWPVSSDRQIWGLAAFEVYKTTGSRQWLEKIYPVIKNSLEDDWKTIYDQQTGLVRGETSFIDWREQSYPTWMQTADIYQSEALGTSVVHAQAWHVLGEIAELMGDPADARTYFRRSESIANAINQRLWMSDKGYYAMYLYGRDHLIVNPRAETLGEALAILYGIADKARSRLITEKLPVTPFGPAIFYPQIPDQPPYHNNSLWPWVAAYWGLANAKVGNSDGLMQAIGSIFRPAALFATNKENFILDNGDIGTVVNSSNMLWCLSGNLAMTLKVLMGIQYTIDGISFTPFIPKVLADNRTLSGLRYRNATLNISVSGYGSKIREFYLNGKKHAPFIPADITGDNTIKIIMDNDLPEPMRVNNVANAKSPVTPVAWLSNDPSVIAPMSPTNNLLQWNPIEYINHYIVLRDGDPIDYTTQTTYLATMPGEYQVIGVSGDGLQSFASQPRSNVEELLFDLPNENVNITSREAQAIGKKALQGYRGDGFVETDHNNSTISIPVDLPHSGLYSISVRYANGNGPVNTDNKCAVRTLFDGTTRLGTIVMPQRGVGNWNDWGYSNTVTAQLSAGRHTLSLKFLPENENMNIGINHALIDQIVIRRLK